MNTQTNKNYTIKYPTNWSYKEKKNQVTFIPNTNSPVSGAEIGVDMIPIKMPNNNKVDINLIMSLVQNKWLQADPTLHFKDEPNPFSI